MIDRASLLSRLAELENQTAEELESEELEFLPWTEDRAELDLLLSRLAVCFANAGGGLAIVGVQSATRGEGAITGCRDYDLDGLRRAIYQATEPGILVGFAELPFRNRTLLVMEVPRGIPPHATRDGFSARRKGAACEIIPRATAPGYDFTAQLLDLGEEAIDPLEIERLRRVLQAKETSSELLRLANHEFLKALNILSPAFDRPRLTVAGLLLAGKESVLKEALPGHEAIFLHMTSETEYDRRADYGKPLISLLEDLTKQVEPYNRIFTMKLGLFHFEIPDFPPEVYREALLNAFMHRDYKSLNPVYVRLYADRLEIGNPGGFVGGVTPDNIISHEPMTRNRLLAEMLQRLGWLSARAWACAGCTRSCSPRARSRRSMPRARTTFGSSSRTARPTSRSPGSSPSARRRARSSAWAS